MNPDRQALAKGTPVEFSGMLATVIEDHGGDTLIVDCEGEAVKWRWTLDGETCKILTGACDVRTDRLKTILDSIEQQPQRQDSTNAQLADLVAFANKLGLYDAADYLRTAVGQR